MKKLSMTACYLLAIVMFAVIPLNLRSQDEKGNKKVVKETRSVDPFTGIRVGGAFNLYLTQKAEASLMIEADENLMEKITTEVTGNVLHITTKSIRNATKLNAYVTMPEIVFLEANGAATIRCENTIQGDALKIIATGASDVSLDLDIDNLRTEASGASDVKLNGTSETHEIEASGASEVDASLLVTKTTKAEASGASNVKVNATEHITRETSGAGSIKITGDPEITTYGDDKSSVTISSVNQGHTYRAGDTTKVKVGSIVVEVHDGDTTRVTVGNHELIVDDEGNVDWKRKGQRKFNGHWAGFEMGINGWFDKDFNNTLPAEYKFLDLTYEKSTEVSINVYEQNFNLARNKLGLITGIGLRWNNYRFDDDIRLEPDSVPIFGYHDTSQPWVKSKLVNNYLTVPLLLEYQTNPYSKTNSFHIAGGMILGWRYASHTKMMYMEDGRHKPKDHDDFNQQPFRYDVTARIGWGIINLYANYSLNELFESGEGPEVYPFTIGITFIGW